MVDVGGFPWHAIEMIIFLDAHNTTSQKEEKKKSHLEMVVDKNKDHWNFEAQT